MCDLYHDDGYGVSFADRVVERSRLEHQCSECRRTLPMGSSYVTVSGTYEGDFFATKMCIRCRKASKWLMARGHGWQSGSVLADVRYCVKQELLEKGKGSAPVRR
jgi:hypothetical protein